VPQTGCSPRDCLAIMGRSTPLIQIYVRLQGRTLFTIINHRSHALISPFSHHPLQDFIFCAYLRWPVRLIPSFRILNHVNAAMSSVNGHKHTSSVTQNHKAQLANAYNELGKELSSNKIRVIGNYTLGRVIGEGAYGKVRMGTHRLTSTRVAIKQIPKAMSASLTREIHHHRQLHHPHITQMYEVIATESSIWIVTELCCGGELFDYLAEKGRLSEDETKIIFGQLCLAVAYLHDNGIVQPRPQIGECPPRRTVSRQAR